MLTFLFAAVLVFFMTTSAAGQGSSSKAARFAWFQTTAANAPTTTAGAPLALKYWYPEFATPQLAAVHSAGPNTINLSMGWIDSSELISLVWDSVDVWDHPWFSYSTLADYSSLVWTFTATVDSHIMPFDLPDGLTLTVELGDGSQHVVRLWNYQLAGTATSATFRVDFGNLAEGWYADTPFPCTNVSKIFLNFVNTQYGSGTKFSGYQYSTATVSTVGITGPKIRYASAQLSANHLQMTVDYDNVYHLNPQRVAEQISGLGYAGFTTCYIGMSHFFKVGWDAAESRFRYMPDSNPVNQVAMGWLSDFNAQLKARNNALIFSLSYEMLASNAPNGWSQLNYTGGPALSGWSPPSTLLAFSNNEVMSYLKGTAAQLLTIPAAGDARYFQIGEPWWWDGSYSDGTPFFYDSATQALYQASYGVPMYVFTSLHDPVTDPNAIRTAAFLASQLGKSTQTIATYIRGLYSNVRVGVLFDVSQASATKLTTTVNYPKGWWRYPSFDFFQLEGYDSVINGDIPMHHRQLQHVIRDLRYPNAQLQYFGGFAMDDDSIVWSHIFTGLHDVSEMEIQNLAIWSWTQLAEHGIVVSWTRD
jgi:hypothetical protein